MSPHAALAPDAVAVPVGDEILVWVPDGDMTHLLDARAAQVLELVQMQEPAEAAALLAARHGADQQQVLADVLQLVAFFQQQRILVTPAS